MSYDLMVFEKTKAPKMREEFMEWYSKQIQWEENHDYNTISVSSQALQNCFMEFKETFPPMNGEFAPSIKSINEDENLEKHLADYCIGREVIYVSFAWTVKEEAYKLMLECAQKHGVGLFDVSGDGGVIMPKESKIKYLMSTQYYSNSHVEWENIYTELHNNFKVENDDFIIIEVEGEKEFIQSRPLDDNKYTVEVGNGLTGTEMKIMYVDKVSLEQVIGYFKDFYDLGTLPNTANWCELSFD